MAELTLKDVRDAELASRFQDSDNDKVYHRSTCRDDNINDPDLYESVEGKPVVRVAAITTTALLNAFLAKMMPDEVPCEVDISFTAADTQLIEAKNVDGETLKKFQVTYSGLDINLIVIPRDMLTEDGLDMETEDGQQMSEEK